MRPTSSRRPLQLQRWVLRLALLLLLTLAALVYWLDVEISQLLRLLGISLLFVGLAAGLGLIGAVILRLIKKLRD